VAADPGLAEAQHQLALAYWKMGLAVEAARSLGRAAELGFEVDPELATRIAREAGDRTNRRPSSSYIDAEHQRFQARVAQLFGSEDPLSALDALDEFLAARPDDVGALALRGDVLARLGHYGPSEADLLRVLELWPGSFDAHYQLAALHRTTGHPLQALAWLRSAIEHVADSEQRAKILLNIAELERETGNLGGAIAAFSQAVVSDPSLERLVNPELADLHTQSDQPD
jgi:tetratricopeptide (TPR) repeat protein